MGKRDQIPKAKLEEELEGERVAEGVDPPIRGTVEELRMRR